MTAPRDASFDDYLVKSMKDPAEAAAYIAALMELDDPAALLVAMRHVAMGHGMVEVARRSDVGDKTLFKALSENGNPTLTTIQSTLTRGRAAAECGTGVCMKCDPQCFVATDPLKILPQCAHKKATEIGGF